MVGFSASAVADSPDLKVESGETVLLGPDSQRFGSLYKRLYPSGIDEVREVLGLSDAAAKAVRSHNGCRPCAVPSGLVSPDDLDSADKATVRRAKNLAIIAATQYVHGASTHPVSQWKPLIDRYLQIGKIAIQYVLLGDIDIANGGTLVVSASTQALYANNITIHGSGRIWCKGSLSIKCTTLQGLRNIFLPGVASAAVAKSV